MTKEKMMIDDKRFVTMLKLEFIAYASMFIDHTTAVLLDAYTKTSDYTGYIWGIKGEDLDDIGRGIGRLAFVIFAYMITQAIQYSKDRQKYLLRLLAFALISEIPFDFCLNNSLFYYSSQNVGFTLLLGAFAITLMIDFEGKRWLQITSVLLCMAVAAVLQTDYGSGGVLLIVLMYVFRHNFQTMAVISFMSFMGMLIVDNTLELYIKHRDSYNTLLKLWQLTFRVIKWYFTSEVFGFLSFVPIYYYSRNCLEGGKLPKFIKYSFYPLHLLVIGYINWSVYGW